MLSPAALENEKDCLAGLRQINAAKKNPIPDHVLPGLARWLVNGIVPGSFLEAMLSNDLRGVMQSADDENLQRIPDIWNFLYMEIPSSAWGSHERMVKWRNGEAF